MEASIAAYGHPVDRQGEHVQPEHGDERTVPALPLLGRKGATFREVRAQGADDLETPAAHGQMPW
jgi:hypothetical protein